MAIQDALKKKLGPLPVGVWVLAIGGGLALSYYVQRDDTEEVEESEELDGSEDFYGYDPTTAPGYSGAVGLPDYGTQSPISQPPQAIVSNSQWLALGVDYLIGIGTSALIAQNALTKYLEGEVVSTQEQALVSQVIRFLGSPPEGAPSVDPGDETPTPDDPEPEDDRGLGSLVWALSVPTDIRERFAAVQVATILGGMGINVGHKYVGVNDIQAGLKKLGYTSSGDLAMTEENVLKLLNLRRNTKYAGNTPTQGWGADVSTWTKQNISVEDADRALKSLGIHAGRWISTAEIKRGLKKLGYKKTNNLKPWGDNVKNLIALRKAKKGE